MSEYDELVRDLNDLQVLPPMECIEDFNDAHDRKLYGRAADAIEALVKERDAALSVRPSMQEWIDHHYARAEAAEAEVERLTTALEFYAKEDNWADHFDRNTGASYTPASRDGGAIARSALEAKP